VYGGELLQLPLVAAGGGNHAQAVSTSHSRVPTFTHFASG
jgi:threonine dehydratase